VLKVLTSVPTGIRGLEATGTLTRSDYYEVFAPIIEEARRSGGRMRLLYQFGPDFERLTAGALWADARLGLGYAQLLDGCAVVSDIEWIRKPARSIGALMPCPVRVYQNRELDDALAWLNSLPEGDNVSVRDLVKAYIGGTGAALASLGALAISKSIKNRRPQIDRG